MYRRAVSTLEGRSLCAFAVVVSVAACAEGAGPTSIPDRPGIIYTVVGENANNSLSALVRFSTRNADSARLTYHARSVIGTNEIVTEQATPFFAIRGDTGTIPVLGMHENTWYDITLDVRRGEFEADTMVSMRAAQLPPELAGLRLNSTGVGSIGELDGYILTDFTGAKSAYIVVFDGTGRVCWYRQFAAAPGEVAIDAEQQPTGDYTMFVGESTGWQPTPGRFIEVNAAGDSINTYSAAAPYTDPHELILEYDGTRLSHIDVLGYDYRRVDLTALGGGPDQTVAGHVILRQSVHGKIEFAWNAWQHLSITDWIFVQPGLAQMPSIDFDHPNSLVRDADGNYIVSFANLGEIMKINATTGQIMWRFGGRNNQFTILGDPLNGFGIQHHAHVLPNGNVLFIDNG